MTTTDEQLLEVPRVKLDQIHTHPLNPRRTAVADEEMVESIRQQGVLIPVMLAPRFDGDGWVLIDGHRRFDGAVKAGVSDVPANPRYDLITEAQQVEVMAITGLQTELLTSVEEAAAYEQLTLLGFDPAAIAASTGFSQARVKSRMKLNTLGDQVRDHLHEGQLTLTDAEAFLEFADNPTAIAELEAAVGTPNFRQTVFMTRSRIERRAARDAEVAALRDSGVPELTPVAGRPGWVRRVDGDDTEVRALGMHSFPWTAEPEGTTRDRGFHIAEGCAGFYVPEGDYVDVQVVCTDPDSHAVEGGDSEATAARAAQESQWEKQQEERRAAAARRRASDLARREWIFGFFTSLFPTKSHQPVAAVTGVVMPFLVAEDGEYALDPAVLSAVLGIEPDPDEANYYTARAEALAAYAGGLQAATSTKKLAGFAAVLTALIAPLFEQDPEWLDDYDDVLQLLVVWDWLTGAGYKLTDVDVETRAVLESKLLALSSDREDDDGDGEEE